MERVAKDWCLSIRASQVIPVYPLTEDLQPGDVFLVQTPIEDQVKEYLGRGFLPLENLVTRLHPGSYQNFYSKGYGLAQEGALPPRVWQFPLPPGSGTDYNLAPRAAFPSYSFSVNRSGGLSVALPVQSVPIGLNLLKASSASGSITIKDCYTYGIDIYTLQDLVGAWARDSRIFTSQFEPILAPSKHTEQQQFYLRIISRVYLTKQVDVSLFASQAGGASATGGSPQQVDLLDLGQDGAEAVRRIAEVNRVLSATTSGPDSSGSVSGSERGGSVKLTMATARSVSMTESFPRPLVIGYIAFDLPIMTGGALGPPVSTSAQLEQRRRVFTGTPITWGADANSARISAWLPKGQNRDRLLHWLEREGYAQDPADIATGAGLSEVRARIVQEFGIK